MILGQKNSYVKAHVLGDEVVLHDEERGLVHVFNPVACSIWKLCDGINTLEDAVAKLSMEYDNVSPSTLQQDILNTIELLRSKELIE